MTTVGKSFGGTAVQTILSDPVKFAENLRKARSGINENIKLNGDFDLFSYSSPYSNSPDIGAAAAFDSTNLLLVARKGQSLQVSTYGENPSGKTVNLFAVGSTEDDALIGGAGNDILVSGGSQIAGDVLRGGGGSDTFVLSEGLTYIHDLSATSTILVPSYNGEFSLTFRPFEEEFNSLEVQVDIGETKFVVNFTLEEYNRILGKNAETLKEAYETTRESEKPKLSSYIMSKVKSLLPNDENSRREANYNSITQSTWNYAFGEDGKDVVGTMGRDSIFGKGKNITMTGGAGGDNFHVKAGMGTIIADFNFHQRDRIVMDDVKLADFKKELVRVERSGADFIVRYNGNIIAKLLNYEGMPRTDAPAKIRELVTGS